MEHLEIRWSEASIHNIQLEEVDKPKVALGTNRTMEAYMAVVRHSLDHCVELKVTWNIIKAFNILVKSQVKSINLSAIYTIMLLILCYL